LASVSIPLKSGLNCRLRGGRGMKKAVCLNPFEIRAELPRWRA